MQQLSKFTAQIKSVRNRIGNIEKEKVVKFVNDVKNWKLHCFLPYWPNSKSVEYWYQFFFNLFLSKTESSIYLQYQMGEKHLVEKNNR